MKRRELQLGRYTFFIGDPKECRVCTGGIVHITWHDIGDLCLRHSIDWMLDDYTSDHDYAALDDSRPRCRTKDCENPYTLRDPDVGWICRDCLMTAYQAEHAPEPFRLFSETNDESDPDAE